LTIDFSLSCFTPNKKKNEKRWSGEICVLLGVKNEKKKKQKTKNKRILYISDMYSAHGRGEVRGGISKQDQ